MLRRKAVLNRFGAFGFVLALAFAYVTGVPGEALRQRSDLSARAAAEQPALVPATRPSLHLGRQVDGSGGLPLGIPSGLLPEQSNGLSAPGWAHLGFLGARAARPVGGDGSSRSTRGPPGLVL